MAIDLKTEPFDVGDEIVIWAAFVNAGGVPANPDDATLQIELPDGTELATIHLAAMTNPVVGTLEYAYTIVDARRHYFRWAATGAVTIAEEGSFGVKTPRLTTPAP